MRCCNGRRAAESLVLECNFADVEIACSKPVSRHILIELIQAICRKKYLLSKTDTHEALYFEQVKFLCDRNIKKNKIR